MFRLRGFCLLGLKRPLFVSSGKVSSGVGAGLRVVRSSTISTPFLISAGVPFQVFRRLPTKPLAGSPCGCLRPSLKYSAYCSRCKPTCGFRPGTGCRPGPGRLHRQGHPPCRQPRNEPAGHSPCQAGGFTATKALFGPVCHGACPGVFGIGNGTRSAGCATHGLAVHGVGFFG